jgi:hypothetical protein
MGEKKERERSEGREDGGTRWTERGKDNQIFWLIIFEAKKRIVIKMMR